MSRAFIAIRGLAYAAGFVALWVWAGATVRVFDARIPAHVPSWTAPIGVVVACAGGALALQCIVAFVTRGLGTPAPFDPPRVFVATGPYRYVRNPMYLGAAGVMFGSGLFLGSPSVLFLAMAFLGLAHLVVICYEEPALTRTFGASYARYQAGVHRWVPHRPL